jgi:hypothetical protein
VANGPILSQSASGTWTTTVVLQASDLCVSSLSYEMVTTPPSVSPRGRITSHIVLPAPQQGASPVPCPTAATGPQAELVTLAFTLPSVPLTATLVITDTRGTPPAPPTEIAMMAIHRFVSPWQYLWLPIVSGGGLAALFLAIGAVVLGLHRPKRDDDGEKEAAKPIYASATWTFKDSWATNLGVGAAAVTAVLSGAGAVSTQLPGVQLDRFAVLMALCGVIIASAPFVFGILYVLSSRSRGMVPDNATLSPGKPVTINIPGGASLTVPTAGSTPYPIGPGKIETGKNIQLIMPGDGTIMITGPGASAVRLRGADGEPGDGNSVEITPPTDPPAGQYPFITVKAAGFATIDLPNGATVKAPDGGKDVSFNRATRLRVPLGSNVIVANFRSLITAALVTLFGIGAELGILGVLAFTLSDRPTPIRWAALFLVCLMGLIVLVYAISTTRALADSNPGSALTADSSTSATL